MQIVPVARQVRDVARSAGKALRSVQLTSDSVDIRVGDCLAVLPASAFHALLEVLELLELGRGIRIVPVQDELTTEEAARLLGVSRPHLVRMVEQGEIPFHKVGSRRRIRASDLAVYLETQAGRKREERVEFDRLLSQLRSRLR